MALNGVTRSEFKEMIHVLIEAEYNQIKEKQKQALSWELSWKKASKGREVAVIGVFVEYYYWIPANPTHAMYCASQAESLRLQVLKGQEKVALLQRQLETALATASFDSEDRRRSTTPAQTGDKANQAPDETAQGCCGCLVFFACIAALICLCKCW